MDEEMLSQEETEEGGNENDKGMDDNDLDSDEYSDYDHDESGDYEEMDDSEIDSLLEEGLAKSKRETKQQEGASASGTTKKTKEQSGQHNNELIIKKITVLEDKGGNTFEVLPGGWIQVRHSSGLPLYLHRKTRVCTLAKPYYLGPASVRRHSIPVSGIPCLAYRRAIEKEKRDQELLEQQAKELESQQQDEQPADKPLIPLAKVETAKENASLYSVAPLDLRNYCKGLFNFTEVECKRFKTWSARRKHTKEQKRKQLERPTLPDNAQVIKFFDLSAWKNGDGQFLVKKFNDYIFNPNGKSSVCILHEFVQHALRKQPTYSFQELENAATPYSATVMINEIPYGRGYGSSKKTAKAEAAKATLEILIPQMKGQLNGGKSDPGSDFDITEYFQQVEMNDVRIPKMCTSVSEPSPYTLLLTCLQRLRRNFGQSGSNSIKFEMIPTDPSKGNPPNQFKMAAGSHSVVVAASNKREGKQLASQLLLSEIHPHITNFGAFIKMYGNGSIKSVKEKKQEEQQITTLQSKAAANSPNWAILKKLRHEMLKLAETEKECKEGEVVNPEASQCPFLNLEPDGITPVTTSVA